MSVSCMASGGGGGATTTATAADSVISAITNAKFDDDDNGDIGCDDGCNRSTTNRNTNTRFEGMAALLGLNHEERVRAFDCVIQSISQEESISEIQAARETLTAVWDYLVATRKSQSDAYIEFQDIVKEHPSFLKVDHHHTTKKTNDDEEDNTTISSTNSAAGVGCGASEVALSEIVSIDDETIRRKIVTPGIERVKAAKTPFETKRAMDQLYTKLKKVFIETCDEAEIAEFARKVVKESLHDGNDNNEEEHENDDLVELLSVMEDVSRAVSVLDDDSNTGDEMNDKKCDNNENNSLQQGSVTSVARSTSRCMSPPPKPEDGGVVEAITDDEDEEGSVITARSSLCKSPPPKPEGDGVVAGVGPTTDDDGGGGSVTSSLCKSPPPKPEDESNNGRDNNAINHHGLRLGGGGGGGGEVEVGKGSVSSDREPRRIPPPSMMMMPEVPPPENHHHHHYDNFSVLSDRIAQSRSPIPVPLPPMPENSPVVVVDEDRVQVGGGGHRPPQPQMQPQPQKLPGKEAHKGGESSSKTERRRMETWEEDAMVEQMCKGMLYFLTLDGREQSMMFDKVVKKTAKDSGIPAKQAATITLQALSDALGHLQQQYEPQHHQQSNGGGGGDGSVGSSHISYPPLPKSPAPFSVSSAGLYDDSSAVPSPSVKQVEEEEMMMMQEEDNMVMIMNGEEKDEDDESSLGSIVVSTVEAININRTILLPGLIRVKQANSPQETCDAMDDMYRALAQHMPGQSEAGIMDFIVKVVRESINQERKNINDHDGNHTI